MQQCERAKLFSKVFRRAAEDVRGVQKLAIELHPEPHVFEAAVQLIVKYEP